MKVEKNTPLPGPTRPNYRHIYNEMEPGDSVLFETEKQAESFVFAARRCKGYKMIRRKQSEGWRVWRVNDEMLAALDQRPNIKIDHDVKLLG